MFRTQFSIKTSDNEKRTGSDYDIDSNYGGRDQIFLS